MFSRFPWCVPRKLYTSGELTDPSVVALRVTLASEFVEHAIPSIELLGLVMFTVCVLKAMAFPR